MSETKEEVTSYPPLEVPLVLTPFQGFVNFIRDQGVVGLAIGIVLGTQVKSLVDSFVVAMVNPVLGLVLPGNGDLGQKALRITSGSKVAVFAWGTFFMQLISFVLVMAIVYFVIHGLKLDRLDIKKKKK
ncbi:MAG: MscL family protein [Candidatus Saccharibacteria bacterium]